MSPSGNWKVLGRSAAIRAIRGDLERVLPRLAPGRLVPPIILQGETGTGKGLLAHTIHGASPRAAGPIPATLEELGMRPLVAHCHLDLGRLYRRTGKHPEASEHLATAVAMYEEMDMRFRPEPAVPPSA